MATAIISALIFGFMTFIIIKEIRRIKSGKSICGGNCSSCSGCKTHNDNQERQIIYLRKFILNRRLCLLKNNNINNKDEF